jgi:hypothetical protein
MRSFLLVPLLTALAIPATADLVLVKTSWTQEVCAAYSSTQDFETFGCQTNIPGVTGSTVTQSDANPGDAVTSATTTDLSAGASIDALLQHNGVDARAAADMVIAQSTQVAAASSAVLTATLRNNGVAPAPFDFTFTIDSGFLQLTLEDFLADGDDVPIAEVKAEIWCETCATDKLAWNYHALYASYNNENQFGVVNDLLDFWDPHGILKPAWNSVDGGNVCDPNPPYDCTHEAHGTLVPPFTKTIHFDMIDPGATGSFRYTIEARSYTGTLSSLLTPTNPPHVAGVATLSDPFGVSDIILINGVPLSELPEPEPIGGAIASLAALAIRARRRRPS